MAITIGVAGETGHGKTTSIVINPDGKCVYLPEGDPNRAETYEGMDPSETVIVNCDKKYLPFPMTNGWEQNKNVYWISEYNKIMTLIQKASDSSKIRNVIIDTCNGIMLDKEMKDSKLPGFDKWIDLAKQIYELISYCNAELRNDMIVFLLFHTALYTENEVETRGILTNGKKLEKIKLESKLPVLLFTTQDTDPAGNISFKFETFANRSRGKTPLGMFKDKLIPNSMRLLEITARKHYGI
jgi:hypothetical protein